MDMGKRLTAWVGALVFLLAATVYFITLTPTVPFWDSGEFIAVSYILGIPHPPGTPLYVLLGRVATLVPWATVAQRVNGLSALASALAVLLTYLTALRLIRSAQGRGPAAMRATEGAAGANGKGEWLAQFGALMAAFMLAFSDNFWENAIEAEVYSLMSLAQILVFWLGLKWWEAHEKRPTAGPLLVCVYVMWLSVGMHLGVGMMGLPLLVLVLMVDRGTALVFAMPFLSVLGVTWGLERMAGIVMLMSTATFAIYAMQKKLNGWVVAGSAVAALVAMRPAFGDENFTLSTSLLATAALGVPIFFLARRFREGRVIALALLLMTLGYSTHVYLPIRAAQHPAVNEGAPSSWESLRYLLERKQYGESSMFNRRGPWSAQLDKEFWRYVRRQWPLAPPRLPSGPSGTKEEPRTWQFMVPLLLGLAGGIWQLRRERVTALTTGCLLAFSTVGMILVLNFTGHEVRDRDYFFTTAFHVFALWIGLGATWLVGWVRESFTGGSAQRYATIGCAALLGVQPLLLLRAMWFTHDRRGNYVAHDYAYNMLAPLAPNSFVFTNGDNDTFPLWYIQEVEGVRKDVRVVNLSLLNTDWYIRQLRDDEPRVPIRLDDNTVRLLGAGAVQDSGGRLIYTNQFMVGHIMEQARTRDGWSHQPYFAVTVPEHMGLDKHFTLEGLVYKVNPDTLHPELDAETTRRSLYHLFKYRGLFGADGSWDTRVYKDENSSTLSRNYAAAHLQLAFQERKLNHIDKAIEEMERVARMFPDYTEVLLPLGGFYIDAGDTNRALELFHQLTQRNPGSPEAHYYYGMTLLYKGRLAEGLRELDTSIQLDPNYNAPYFSAYSALRMAGQYERALSYLERWLDGHPGDTQARELLDQERQVLRGQPLKVPPLPRPPVPALP